MRRYREDAERVIYIGPHYVRRPQAAPVSRGATWRDLFEIVSAFVVLGIWMIAGFLWLAIAAT